MVCDWIGEKITTLIVIVSSLLFFLFATFRTKALVGWLNYTEIQYDGSFSVQASQLADQVYAIRKDYKANEYLLIENRQPLLFDRDFFGNGGIVIYHIDDNVANYNQDIGYPGDFSWPRFHARVAVVQADGLFDLERGKNNGDNGDLWLNGMSLGPGPVQPNTDSYAKGAGNSVPTIDRTNITITVTTASQNVMTFTVSGLGIDPTGSSTPTAPAPSQFSPTAPVPSPTATAPSQSSPTAPVPSQSTLGPTSYPTVSPNACSLLQPGDLPIFMFNSQNPDLVLFFPLAIIGASVGSLFLTDRAWNGTAFVGEEGIVEVSVSEGKVYLVLQCVILTLLL